MRERERERKKERERKSRKREKRNLAGVIAVTPSVSGQSVNFVVVLFYGNRTRTFRERSQLNASQHRLPATIWLLQRANGVVCLELRGRGNENLR